MQLQSYHFAGSFFVCLHSPPVSLLAHLLWSHFHSQFYPSVTQNSTLCLSGPDLPHTIRLCNKNMSRVSTCQATSLQKTTTMIITTTTTTTTTTTRFINCFSTDLIISNRTTYTLIYILYVR